jgi:tellurite methyltransferase
MAGELPGATVSPFVVEWLPRIAEHLDGRGTPQRALDLAMGDGRHTIPLAEAGFITYGVDRALDRLLAARRRARPGDATVLQWAADLDTYPLPPGRFDLLFCTRFLLRARWDDLKRTVTPGGFVLYETFTIGQVARGVGPASPEHLLRPGELERAFADWRILFSEEQEKPSSMARLVARKPGA